ncbi:MAG: exodeoxyribonuclease VII large subunit [Saprospiraceae bacterium]
MTPLSLFEINEYIRQVIALNFTEPIWIKAEINQLSFSRGHCYLELIEKKADSDEIIAQANAAIWFRNLKFIEHKTGPNLHHILQKGLQVLLKTKIDYSERYGLKFSVEDIDTSFTIGQLEIKRREIIIQLEQEGLFEKNKNLPMPMVLQRIAIISSERAAGMQDFINHLQDNAYDFAFRCELFSAAMQGKNVEKEMIKACQDILKEKIPYDAIIIIRGGGSKLDLASFDSYKLCAHLAKMPYPVITGIGHDIDQSIADLVAHTSLKTPTAVANFIIDHNLKFEALIYEKLRTIESLARNIIKHQTREIHSLGNRIKYIALESIQSRKFRLLQIPQEIKYRVNTIFKNHHKDLLNALQIITILDPLQLLKRGYSMTTKNGKLVHSIQDVIEGDLIETRISDGMITSKIQ